MATEQEGANETNLFDTNLGRRRNMRPVSLLVDPGIYERITFLAQKEECSISEWIRNAIEASLFQEYRHGNSQWD